MEAHRFDRLARRLSGAVSRRTTLAALLGAGLAGIVEDAEARNKKRRKRTGKSAGKQRRKKPQRSPAGDAVAAEAADCLNPGPSSNMNRCNFNDRDFAFADLSSSSMRETTFRGADLCGADLSSSQLKQANFSGFAADKTDLTRADFRSSGCNGTKFGPNTVLCGTRMCNGAVRNDHCPAGADPEFACCADGGCEPGHRCENGNCCNVCDDGCEFDSLAAAVAAAEDGDTIRFCAGTFRTPGVSVNKDLTIVGAGSGAGGTALHPGGSGDVLRIAHFTEVEMRDLRVTGGDANGNGAGIVNQGTLRLVGITVTGNFASGSGGGILNQGTLTLGNGSRVEGNHANARGGGILNASGTTTLEAGSVVTGNTTADGPGLGGGGVFESGGAVNVADTTIVTGNSPNNCQPEGAIPNCVD